MIRGPALSSGLALVMLLTILVPAWPQDLLNLRSRSCYDRPRAGTPPSSTVFCRSTVRWFPAMPRSFTTGRSQCSMRPASGHGAHEPGKFVATEEQAAGAWITGPLESIPLDQARQRLETYRTALVEARLGARRQTCNWEFDLRSEGIELLIPEIQNMRSLIRLVTLKARVAVIDGKIDEAIEWLQTGYAMARHASEGPILIQGLVGVAMTAVMARPLEDLIQ